MPVKRSLCEADSLLCVSDTSFLLSEDSNNSDDSGFGQELSSPNSKVFTDFDTLSPLPPAYKRQRLSPNSSVDSVLADDTDLIADGSRPHSLPTVPGKHADIKSISPDTLADVLSGHYTDTIQTFLVVDCRFPYEYNGGHIKKAVNLYSHAMVEDLLLHKSPAQVLIFHCEFSQERGPSMLRHLRSKDRQVNSDIYPSLTFPEIYLVDSGYKALFHSCPSLCEPAAYLPMDHPDYSVQLRHYRRSTEALRHFRSKAKSWSAGDKPRASRRAMF